MYFYFHPMFGLSISLPETQTSMPDSFYTEWVLPHLFFGNAVNSRPRSYLCPSRKFQGGSRAAENNAIVNHSDRRTRAMNQPLVYARRYEYSADNVIDVRSQWRFRRRWVMFVRVTVHSAHHVKITDFGLAKLVSGDESFQSESCKVRRDRHSDNLH